MFGPRKSADGRRRFMICERGMVVLDGSVDLVREKYGVVSHCVSSFKSNRGQGCAVDFDHESNE